MKWWPGECNEGDMIRVNLGSLYHYGIFVSEDEVIQFGLPPAMENHIPDDEVRVCSSSIETFACGKIIEKAQPERKELKSKRPAEEVIKTARSRMGEGGYDLLNNNCEHFAYECFLGVKKSEQQESMLKRWLR